MKSFFQFLESTAVQQATRMGLKSDGHGGWYDKKGEFVAKTEKGQLRFFNARQNADGRDPKQTDKEERTSGVLPPGRTEPTQQAVQGQQQEEPAFQPNKKNKGTRTIAFGRFNPPTKGHAHLMDVVKN